MYPIEQKHLKNLNKRKEKLQNLQNPNYLIEEKLSSSIPQYTYKYTEGNVIGYTKSIFPNTSTTKKPLPRGLYF